MKAFLQLEDKRRKDLLDQVSALSGLTMAAIEKDWWVTAVLKAIFTTNFSDHLIFKGGTSLSKGWNLIDRFSEDIDVAIDREFLGFRGDLTREQVKKLRKVSCSFVKNEFSNSLRKRLSESGINDYELIVPELKESDVDPFAVELHYNSVAETIEYLPNRVIIETGARSLMEPAEKRPVQSMMAEYLPDSGISDSPELISIVLPKRTFLEKAFLLHEEFQKPGNKISVFRKSRHLYDLEKLMDTTHGQEALRDKDLYQSIVTHREKFFRLSGVDYSSHSPDRIDFIPPEVLMPDLEKDYNTMRENMIFGESLTFDQLIKRIKDLNVRFKKA